MMHHEPRRNNATNFITKMTKLGRTKFQKNFGWTQYSVHALMIFYRSFFLESGTCDPMFNPFSNKLVQRGDGE